MRPGAVIVRAQGELDAFCAPDLTRALEQTGDAPGLVVDLELASFLDSTALGLVIRALRELEEAGREARIVLPRGDARRIFEITTLDRVLPVSGSLRAALDELGTPTSS